MNSNPLEKVIEHQVCDFARKLGCYAKKFTSPSSRSVPDRILITPHGVTFFIEFKRRGEVSTPAQHIEQEKIRAHGVKVFVVDNVLDGRNVVSAMVDAMRDPMF